MLWRTHFLAGAAAGLLMTGHHADIKTAAISAGVAGVAALLPDLDSPYSKLGRLVAPVSWTLKMTIGNRGPLHSLLGAVVMTLLAAFVLRFWYTQAYVYGHLVPLVLMGYLSHLAMDSLNPQGVPWLWPIKKHFGLPLIQPCGLLERIIVIPVMLILCGWLAWMIVR